MIPACLGETPLHIALRQDHYECALLLIARGARLDIPNGQGQVLKKILIPYILNISLLFFYIIVTK